MLDVIFIISIIVFFLAALAYLKFCDGLRKGATKE